MKTKKVEIELPDIDGYEFVGYRTLVVGDDSELYVYMEFDKSEFAIDKITCLKVNSSRREFLYRKRKPRRIIYEEVREDHLNRGDFYLIDSDVYMWTSDTPSSYKRQILKKVHNDFEVNND